MKTRIYKDYLPSYNNLNNYGYFNHRINHSFSLGKNTSITNHIILKSSQLFEKGFNTRNEQKVYLQLKTAEYLVLRGNFDSYYTILHYLK
jgi:hypothetical protein